MSDTVYGPRTFRKRHAYAEAVQWTGENPYNVRAFTGMYDSHFVFTVQDGIDKAELFVALQNSWVPIAIGDWVVRHEEGFRHYTPEAFAAAYEEISSE
jgi:hypothetical protein